MTTFGTMNEGGTDVSYLLFVLVGWFVMLVARKSGMTGVDDTTWLCLAILTAGEVISWRCKK